MPDSHQSPLQPRATNCDMGRVTNMACHACGACLKCVSARFIDPCPECDTVEKRFAQEDRPR